MDKTTGVDFRRNVDVYLGHIYVTRMLCSFLTNYINSVVGYVGKTEKKLGLHGGSEHLGVAHLAVQSFTSSLG